MRLKEVSLKNFRGFKDPTPIPIDPNITGITGRNDVGKSSILEALDVFFEGGEVTLEKDDFNVSDPDGAIEIRCTFDDLPAEIVLDESNKTSLTAEHLLNSDGELEILKRYKRGSKAPTVSIIANHPTVAKFDDLHTLKIDGLKKRAKELAVADADVTDARASAAWRAAIWSKAPSLGKKSRELEISEFAGDSKTIQDKLLQQLPLFALFKSDRESKDNDPQAKNPLQAAVKQAQEELRSEIDKLEKEIQKRVLDRASKTLEKLNEMDPALASKLLPRFKKAPTWSFDFTLDGEDSIPINKRGSGVRRLVLLNFFRAEAERRIADKNAPSVIYAFEEPETSQHPSNQEMLIRALIQIGMKDTCQVLVTTHVPALAGLLPTDGLRFVEKNDKVISILYGSDDVLEKISNSLGVLPDPNVGSAKALILVEGPSDVVFLRHAATSLKSAGHLASTLDEKKVFAIPIGGCGNLKHWKTKKLADQFGIPWGILLDSDLGTAEEPRRKASIDALKKEGKKAYLTRKREPENYILPEVITPHIRSGGALSYSDTDDAKQKIAVATIRRADDVLEAFWVLMTPVQIRATESYTDSAGKARFEFSEMISDLLTLAGSK